LDESIYLFLGDILKAIKRERERGEWNGSLAGKTGEWVGRIQNQRKIREKVVDAKVLIPLKTQRKS